MLNFFSHQGNANSQDSDILLGTHQDGYIFFNLKYKTQTELWSTLCTVGGVVIVTATLENCLSVPTRAEYMHALCLGICLIDMHTYVHQKTGRYTGP